MTRITDELACWLFLFLATALSLAALVWDNTFAHTTGHRWEEES